VNTEVGSPDSGEKARVPVRVAVKTHREERERERVWLRGVLVFELWILRERERENWRFY
jgi:hypothetical protein